MFTVIELIWLKTNNRLQRTEVKGKKNDTYRQHFRILVFCSPISFHQHKKSPEARRLSSSWKAALLSRG